MSALPIESDCTQSRLQHSGDLATYRKHDWPNTLSDPRMSRGYQASDSVLERRSSRTIVIQTFDFGTDGRVFGRFDGGRGDGGQVLLFVGGWASFAMTEDGGGVQWFIGETCRSSVDQDARVRARLAFPKEVREERWLAAVAKLNITANPNVCPRHFNDAFTRYRMDDVEFPFRIIEGPTPREASSTEAPGDRVRALRRHRHCDCRPSRTILLCQRPRSCSLGTVGQRQSQAAQKR